MQDEFSDNSDHGAFGELTELPDAVPSGGRIGPYRLQQKLGEGGMGEVWLAEQKQPVRRRVALKIIKHGMDSKQVIARFEAERQALALMDHPAVARVFEAGTTPEGRPYFAMEFVQGIPITEHCDRYRLNMHERLELFLQVCEGVQHAHQKAIIHRDLKPSNVLVSVQDDEPHPKIIDFGVAKATAQRLTERTVFTELGMMIGTPEYMSPEQAEMSAQSVDTRSDVYSLGVMLYELLTGSLPIDSKELRSAGYDGLRRKICEEEPPKPSTRMSRAGATGASAKRMQTDPTTLRRQLRGDLDWITLRALEKDRTRRYGSPSELAADIRRHMEHQPVLAGPPGALYKSRKFVRRHRLGVAAAGVVVLGLAIGIVGSTMGWLQARRAEARARAEAEIAQQVSAFLADLLKGVNPQRAGLTLLEDLRGRVEAPERFDDVMIGVNLTDAGRKLIDEEILARAVETIESELSGQPEIAARLYHTVGRAYDRLGLFDPAERHLSRAVTLRERQFGAEHASTLQSMIGLGWVYYHQGRYPESEALLDRTYTAARTVLGEESEITLQAMHNLAGAYHAQRRYEDAEAMFRGVLELRRRVLGEEDRDTLASANNLAISLYGQRRLDESEALHRQTLEIRRRTLGPDDRETLASMNNLANAYSAQGRHAEAESLHRETLDILIRVRGADHPETLNSRHNLANVCSSQGRHDEAAALHRETLEGRRRVLGRNHPMTLRSLNGLGNVYYEQGRWADAETQYREALSVHRRTPGASRATVANVLYNLACLAALQRQQGQALAHLRQAVQSGFDDADWIEADDDLAHIRDTAEFRSIVALLRDGS